MATEIWIKEPSEESISIFFDGMCKSAFLFYIGGNEGMHYSYQYGNDKFGVLSEKFFKRLHEEYFKELKHSDSIELSFEFSSHIEMERLMAQFWVLCGVINPKATKNIMTQADRNIFYRKISDETVISYFMGLSWLMKGDAPNREEKLMKFYRFVRDKFKLDVSDERLHEIEAFYYDSERIFEWRLIGMDILGIRQHTRKVLQEKKEKENEQK